MYQLESTVMPAPKLLKTGRWNSGHHSDSRGLLKPGCWGTIRCKALVEAVHPQWKAPGALL